MGLKHRQSVSTIPRLLLQRMRIGSKRASFPNLKSLKLKQLFSHKCTVHTADKIVCAAAKPKEQREKYESDPAMRLCGGSGVWSLESQIMYNT
ncbi:hypothetical protein SUGI_0051760 [Cryptomeria japonica]|nr:hypothetical protein SUGI_0051760 [Cryptomeria japonica]